MIGNHLQRLAREVFIDVIRSLLGCEMRAEGSVFSERFRMERKKRGLAVHGAFDAPAADFANVQVVANRQQFRRVHVLLRVVLNLFLTQVFHSGFLLASDRGPGGFTLISWRKLSRITIGH